MSREKELWRQMNGKSDAGKKEVYRKNEEKANKILCRDLDSLSLSLLKMMIFFFHLSFSRSPLGEEKNQEEMKKMGKRKNHLHGLMMIAVCVCDVPGYGPSSHKNFLDPGDPCPLV